MHAQLFAGIKVVCAVNLETFVTTRALAGLSRRPAAGVPAKRNTGGALGYVPTWTAAMSVARMAGGTAFNKQTYK